MGSKNASVLRIRRQLPNLFHLPHKLAGVPSKASGERLAENLLHLPREGAGVATVLLFKKKSNGGLANAECDRWSVISVLSAAPAGAELALSLPDRQMQADRRYSCP
jgi:hypothetical protein